MYSKRQNICSTLILTTTNNLNRMVLFLINFFDNIYHQIVLSNILLISQTQKKGKRREGKKVISLKFGSFGCYGHCSNSRMVWFGSNTSLVTRAMVCWGSCCIVLFLGCCCCCYLLVTWRLWGLLLVGNWLLYLLVLYRLLLMLYRLLCKL